MFRRLIPVFVVAFVLNAAWEHAHAALYVHYQGGAITSLLLFRAALFDATVITLLGALFLFVGFLRFRTYLVVVPAVLFAIGLERFALLTDRWAYTDVMPIIPILGTGLSPTVQLGLIAYVTFLLTGIGRYESH